MAEPKYKSRKELERLLSEYEKVLQELCYHYEISPKRDKNPKKRIKAAAEELREICVKTEDQPCDYSSVCTAIESGIEVIKETIKLLQNDLDPVQQCSAVVRPRALSDTERKSLQPRVILHGLQIKDVIQFLENQSKTSSASQELFGNFLQVYKKMDIYTEDPMLGFELQRLRVVPKGDPVSLPARNVGGKSCRPAVSSNFNIRPKVRALTSTPKPRLLSRPQKRLPTDVALCLLHPLLVFRYVGLSCPDYIEYNNDCPDWKPEKPTEDTTDADVKYSVSSCAGMFECSETGLRWRCIAPVSLEYRFVSWELFRAELDKLNYCPCGPLMDITVTLGSLEEIHLPHFICVDSVTSEAVRALHIEDNGVSVETCELSPFHAKLLNPTFSLWGIVAGIHQYFTMKCYCDTLIYRTRTPTLNLHVYLIVRDPYLRKVVEKEETGNKFILKPKPNEAQKINEPYTLKTSCVSSIKPESLILTPSNPNFFDVYIKNAREKIGLHIMTKNEEKIWDVDVQSDYFNINSSFTDGGQATNSMSDVDVSDVLLDRLKCLESDKLNEFIWHLKKGVENFPKIPESDLEEADRLKVVNCMIDKYEEDGAADVTVIILRKIQMNNDAKQLEEMLNKIRI